MTTQTVGDLLGAVERIGPLIAEEAGAAEANRRLSGSVYQAMEDAGLFGMLAPKKYGGLELHPTECMRVWETIARIDSAAAWNLFMNQAVAGYAAWLSPEGVAELFGSGIPTVAGALNPPARRYASTEVGGLPARFLSAADAITQNGWPFRPRRTAARPLAFSSGANRPKFSIPGTRWACAVVDRPTTRYAICSLPSI
jgi:hypothetical protein